MSRAVAAGSVQQYARQLFASLTRTTRISPPAGFQVAAKVLTVLVTTCWYCQHSTCSQPRAWPARLARLRRLRPYLRGRPGPRRPAGTTGGTFHKAALRGSRPTTTTRSARARCSTGRLVYAPATATQIGLVLARNCSASQEICRA